MSQGVVTDFTDWRPLLNRTIVFAGLTAQGESPAATPILVYGMPILQGTAIDGYVEVVQVTRVTG